MSRGDGGEERNGDEESGEETCGAWALDRVWGCAGGGSVLNMFMMVIVKVLSRDLCEKMLDRGYGCLSCALLVVIIEHRAPSKLCIFLSRSA